MDSGITEVVWAHAIADLNHPNLSLLAQSPHDPRRRVYRGEAIILKVFLHSGQGMFPARTNSLRQEFDVLNRLAHAGVAPAARKFLSTETIEAIEMDIAEGHVWSSLPRYFPSDVIRVFSLLSVLWRCSLHGVCHNDLLEQNIIISMDNKCCLIDFDQATICSPAMALLSNFGGLNSHPGAVKMRLIQTLRKRLMPKAVFDIFKRIKNRINLYKMRRTVRLPRDPSIKLQKLAQAWKLGQVSSANAPGLGVAYYSLDVDEVKFLGERPWDERWKVLKDVMPFEGKRVLELGCNMGLLSCFLLKEKRASAALAVDCDMQILNSGKLVAEAYEVPAKFQQVDFDDSSDWERELVAFDPDIVFALNVINWVKDKDRFIKFLSNFPAVIIEGHDSFEVEVNRMNRFVRFSCSLVHISERGRPLIVCRRD